MSPKTKQLLEKQAEAIKARRQYLDEQDEESEQPYDPFDDSPGSWERTVDSLRSEDEN